MTIDAITIETGAHVVHFYENDANLIATVGGYVAAAIGAGDAALIVATGDHREALAGHLEAAGIDVAEARRTESLVTIDAAATLARFYADGQIDLDEFRSVIGGTIRHIAERTGRAVRCHGEMVTLLWDAGAVTAAIDLEDLWNDLSRELDFSLLCTYPNRSVAGPEHELDRMVLRQLHSDVVDTRHGAERHFWPGPQGAAGMPGTLASLTELSALSHESRVHMATGMVAVQLGVTTAEALDRLRTFAADHHEALDEVAEAVVSRELRFHDPDPGPH